MNIAILNTKGGTGKTIISTQVLPAFFMQQQNYSKNINIFEIDNNNKSVLKDSSLNFKTLDLSKAEEALQEADYNYNDVNIIDVGGGDDVKKVLEYIQKNDVLIDYFFVPVLNDFEQIHNVKQTIKMIKNVDSEAKIYLILNKVKSLDENEIKEQFIFIFGSEKYGIDGALDELQEETDGMLFLLDSNIYSILKNIYHKSLADVLEIANEYINNIKEYKRKWRSGLDINEYKKQMQFYSFLKDAKNLADINAAQFIKANILKEGE